jgi:LysM repeat protein
MTDDPSVQGPGASGAGQGAPDDALEALQRLEALSGGNAPRRQPAPEARDPRPPRHAAPAAAAAKGASSAPGRPRPRPRPAGDDRYRIARIAAPAVFLVAVVVMVSLLWQSGMVGGADTPVPAATKTEKAGGVTKTKVYVVKEGDTLSGIADKYGVTVTELKTINPELPDDSTLVVGKKIRVPR